MAQTELYDKNFAPLPVADLLDGKHHFVIPSFQRGYRWERKQVLDLLEDINQFANDDIVSGDSYFLQPIVVKAVKWNDEDAWEVLDGQQRLTTMLLVIKRLMKRLSKDEITDFEESLYNITYTNRPQLDFDNPNPIDNIDSFYLFNSKEVIDDWFNDHKRQNLDKFKACLLYEQKKQVKFIWYAIDQDSKDLISINIFNRLNKGKISLTSSELIKALFIMDYDLHDGNGKLASEQLSMEWNEMERKFQDDNFWYFISDDNHNVQTRIDVLFDFVTQCSIDDDTDYSYRQFQKLFDYCREKERGSIEKPFDAIWTKDIETMEDAWRKVRKTFDRLVSWHEDNIYYHYVGFLIAVGYTPLEVYNSLENAKANSQSVIEGEESEVVSHEWTIDDTVHELYKMMMDKFKTGNTYLSKDDIDDLEYSNSDLVFRLLLLFNIESCKTSENVRFAFDKFKKEMWDIEHIDSQNDATIQEYEERLDWMKRVEFILRMENTDSSTSLADLCASLQEKFRSNNQVTKKDYEDLYKRVTKHFSAEVGEDEEIVDLNQKKKDYISNLTLLDSKTNREYKDSPFSYKRYCIIKYDRTGKRFIPLCTRNLFLKYYTESDKEASQLDVMRWSMADRACYMKAMHDVVDVIFDSVTEKK